MCSEADAFVASSLTTFPITARLVFLVVGPAVDLKLIALQAGTFGGRFCRPVRASHLCRLDLLRSAGRPVAAVTDSAGSWIAVLVGFTVLRLSLTDLYLRYVRSGMRPWLVLAGVVLVGVGVVGLLARRHRHIGDEADGVSGTGTGAAEPGHGLPAVAALLLVPVAAVLVVAPAPLGAYAAGRQGQASSSGRKPPANLTAPKDGAVNLSLAELDAGQDLSAVRVRLVGFVSSGPAEADGFVLTRFQISCCAADARAVSVAARGVMTGVPRRDTNGGGVFAFGAPWVEVVGRPAPTAGAGAAVQVESLKRISAPRDPYE